MSRNEKSMGSNQLSPYWQTVKEYVGTLDPRSAMAFIKSHSTEDIQALAKALFDDKVPKKTLADILDNIAGHGGTIGFTALPTLATLVFALPLHGLHVPTMQFNYTDYSIYDALCGIHLAAMGARIKELETAQTELNKQISDKELETAQTELNKQISDKEFETALHKKVMGADSIDPNITLELNKLKEKQAALTAQKKIFWGMLTTIATGITAYVVTSPDSHMLTHALSATAIAHASGAAGLALGFIFVGIMTTLAVIEAKQAAAAEKRTAMLEKQLEAAITNYTQQSDSHERYNQEYQKDLQEYNKLTEFVRITRHLPDENTDLKYGSSTIKEARELWKLATSEKNTSAKQLQQKLDTKTAAAEKVNALTNLLYFEKAQAATHKTNSLLFAGTTTTLLGSTAAMTTFMIMAIVGASVAGGAVTMGAVPLAFGLACAAIALYRWYRNTHPAEVKPVKNMGDTPMTMGELEQENKRSSNWAGLFNKKPVISVTPSKSDSHAEERESTRVRHHYSPIR